MNGSVPTPVFREYMRQVSVPTAQKCRTFSGKATEIAKRGRDSTIRSNPGREGRRVGGFWLAGGIGPESAIAAWNRHEAAVERRWFRLRTDTCRTAVPGDLPSDPSIGGRSRQLSGDAINVVLAAAGSNLRKLLGLLRRRAGRFVFALIWWCQGLIDWLRNLIAALPDRRTLYLPVA